MHTRHLRWYGGQGGGQYDGVVVVLKQRPWVANVRPFVELDYDPAANRALVREPHRHHWTELSTAERDAIDMALRHMAQVGRAAFMAPKGTP